MIQYSKYVFEDIENNVWLNLRCCVEDNVGDRVHNNVSDNVWAKVYDNIKRNVRHNTQLFARKEL